MTLQLRNPHSVLAALETRPNDVIQVNIPTSHEGDDAWARVATLARARGVKLLTASGGRGKPGANDRSGGRDRDRERDRAKENEGGRLGGAEATVKDRPNVPVEELFSGAKGRDGGKGLWLALDGLQDPHNVGAIFRAAAFFGVQGILLTQERSAPLTSTVYDIACGGLEYVPFCQIINLQRGFEKAKEAGLWILGTSEHAKEDLSTVQRDRPWLLTLGNEEKGMRRLTQESCDVLTRIAPRGKVTSLNVSVAAGICIATLSGR